MLPSVGILSISHVLHLTNLGFHSAHEIYLESESNPERVQEFKAHVSINAKVHFLGLWYVSRVFVRLILRMYCLLGTPLFPLELERSDLAQHVSTKTCATHVTPSLWTKHVSNPSLNISVVTNPCQKNISLATEVVSLQSRRYGSQENIQICTSDSPQGILL